MFTEFHHQIPQRQPAAHQFQFRQKNTHIYSTISEAPLRLHLARIRFVTLVVSKQTWPTNYSEYNRRAIAARAKRCSVVGPAVVVVAAVNRHRQYARRLGWARRRPSGGPHHQQFVVCGRILRCPLECPSLVASSCVRHAEDSAASVWAGMSCGRPLSSSLECVSVLCVCVCVLVRISYMCDVSPAVWRIEFR